MPHLSPEAPIEPGKIFYDDEYIFTVTRPIITFGRYRYGDVVRPDGTIPGQNDPMTEAERAVLIDCEEYTR